VRLAAVQMDAALQGGAARRDAMTAQAAKAADQGARVIVFPELALTGYGAGSAIKDTASPLGGEAVSWLTGLAGATGCAIVSGLALETAEDLENAAVFVTPAGHVTPYSKIHLYGDYEKGLFTPGRTRPPLIRFEGLTFGLLVCFDVEFPERVRDLALRGADAVLVPTALPQSSGGAFIAGSVLPVRAFENQVFIAYANHAGRDTRFAYQGHSSITAPDGSFLARGTAGTADLLLADLEVGAYDACRAQNPYLDGIRTLPDLEAAPSDPA